jgi:anti-sigma28 factor (negative regulator of flagellin synthesis)
MDDFVEHMLKSAEEKKKAQPHNSEVDPDEIEELTKEIQAKLRK